MNIIKKRKKLGKKLGKRKKKERRETKSDMISLFLLYTITFARLRSKQKFTFHEKQNKGCNVINKEQSSSSKIITYHEYKFLDNL